MKKRICIYSEKWQLNGGVEKYILNNLQYMDTTANEYFILVSQIETNEYSSFLEDKNVKLIPVLDHKINNPVKRTFNTILNIKAVLKKYRFDTIEFNISNGVSLIYAYLAKIVDIDRRIVHSHNSYITDNHLNGKLKLFAHYFFKFIFRNMATDFVACSDKAAEWMFTSKKIRNGQVIYLKNGVDTSKFAFCEEERKSIREKYNLQNKLVVGNIGRMHSQKNQIFLLKIFRALTKKHPEFTLLLIGEGYLFDYLNSIVKKEKMEKKVLFVKNTNQVRGFLSAMDVFVLPSIYEGFPIVGVEAQANGLPCVFSERMTKEVCINENTIQLKLEDDIEKWVTFILNYAGKRIDIPAKLKNFFDIQKTAKEYELFLLK